MIGRKGKRPVLPRRTPAGRTTPRFVFDSGNKVEKASSGMKNTKGSKVKPGPSHGADPAKQPVPPCVKDEREVDPDDAIESRIIREVLYDAHSRKNYRTDICLDVCPPDASDEDFFLPYPLDGAQEIESDDDPDLEIEYVFY